MPTMQLTDDVIETLHLESGQQEFYDEGYRFPGSFGLRVGSGGRKSFFVVLRIRGRRKRMNVGIWPIVDLESARERAGALAVSAAEGRDPVAEARFYKQLPNFALAAEEYLSEIQEAGYKPRTVSEYRRLLHKELLPIWGDVCIADISAEEITRMLAECALERGLVPLANRIRALVSAIMNFSVEQRYLDSNPVLQTQRMYESPTPLTTHSFLELQQIWAFLRTQENSHAVALRCLMLSAQRVSTIVRMRWDEIQVDTWWPDAVIKRPIYLHPSVLASFSSLKSRTSRRKEFVFADESGNTPRDLRKPCKLIEKSIGVDGISPSSIRASVLEEFSNLNIPADVRAYIAGRMSAVKQLNKGDAFDWYLAQTQNAYTKWFRKLNAEGRPPKSSGDAKVIPLFK